MRGDGREKELRKCRSEEEKGSYDLGILVLVTEIFNC